MRRPYAKTLRIGETKNGRRPRVAQTLTKLARAWRASVLGVDGSLNAGSSAAPAYGWRNVRRDVT
jgi:hypothetical protein